jgi:hypothetical protein
VTITRISQRFSGKFGVLKVAWIEAEANVTHLEIFLTAVSAARGVGLHRVCFLLRHTVRKRSIKPSVFSLKLPEATVTQEAVNPYKWQADDDGGGN